MAAYRVAHSDRPDVKQRDQWNRQESFGVVEGKSNPSERTTSEEPVSTRELKAQGMRPVDIAKALKIGRASVYRVLGSSG
jgi:hypothetical protein